MNHTSWERVQSVFHEAVALPDAERPAFLKASCGDDEEMMTEALAMLKADSRNASLLDRGLPEVAYQMVGHSLDLFSFREFGPYRLKSVLGEGGMGVVWLAERADAGNLVAIKFLPHAGLSPARRERFAREIKTLGKLKHRYIARFYDAGTLADGTPWFVMEYVNGIRLVDYCRAREHSIEEKLKLFRMVCEAVQYAHGQEIIHRDLKPSNILVEPDGTPRLLDFGIAKELHVADDPSDQTRPGLRFLSPHYAAPEWARDGTVGLYTDVYSLGVILYEMLTGALPTGTGNQPDKPSVVVNESSLSKAAWSDLDVLCLKAISREPHERYQSVEALIRDIDHYLKGEPLEARPDSLSYRFRKFVVRNRSAVLAASLTATILVGLVIFFTLRLTAARNSALAEATRTQRVEHFLESLFEGGDKDAGPADNLRVTTLLDRGVQEAQGLNSDPAVQSELYETLGTVYRQLGKLDRADSLLHSALERRKLANHQDASLMADSLLELGLLRVDQAQLSEAERLIRKALAIDQRQFPSGHPKLIRATAALGRVLEEQGHYDQAIELLNGSLRFQPAQSVTIDLANSLVLLADAHFYLGHYAASDSLNWQALKMRQQLYGSQHPRVAENFINLGNAQIQLGHYPEAEQHFRQALAINQSWYGENHPETARSESYLAQALNWEDRYDESRILTQKALTTTEQTYGKEHPRVALVLSNLGFIDLQLRKLDAAEADFNRMTAIYRSAYGEQHQFTAAALANLATVYLKKEQYVRAEQVFRNVLQIYNRVLPAGHLNTAIAQIRLGRVLVRQNRYREAEDHTLAGYAILAKQASPSLDYLQGARSDLVKIYEALQQPDKATQFRAELAANQPKNVAAPGRN